MKNKKTLYHFVLDKSGSMYDCIEATISGFNSQMETIKELQSEFPEQKFMASLTIFDNSVETVFSQVGISDFKSLNYANYCPKGTTALLDAIGISINEIRIKNETKIISDEMSVVMVILTDGMENASREFTYHQIAASIKSLEETGRWTFTFLGADIDAIHTSKMLNIREQNVISFDKGDMNTTMKDISDGIRFYTSSKSEGITKKDFLDFIENKDRRK